MSLLTLSSSLPSKERTLTIRGQGSVHLTVDFPDVRDICGRHMDVHYSTSHCIGSSHSRQRGTIFHPPPAKEEVRSVSLPWWAYETKGNNIYLVRLHQFLQYRCMCIWFVSLCTLDYDTCACEASVISNFSADCNRADTASIFSPASTQGLPLRFLSASLSPLRTWSTSFSIVVLCGPSEWDYLSCNTPWTFSYSRDAK